VCVLLFINFINTVYEHVLPFLLLENFLSSDLNKMNTKYNIEQFNDSVTLLEQIQVVLLTTSENDRQAVLGYLKPLKNNTIYNFIPLGTSKDTFSKGICCTIAEYGSCIAAILKVDCISLATKPSSIVLDHFPNLCAVFTVGVIYGIMRHVKMWDVLISTKLFTCSIEETHSELVKNSVQNFTLQFLCDQFNQSPSWPCKDNNIVTKLKDSSLSTPCVKQGSILCCNIVDNDKFEIKVLSSLSDDIIGIDMEATPNLSDHCRRNNICFMIVKAVGSLGDSKYDRISQQTAALLAADCLHHYLSDPQLPHNLAASRGWWIITV